MDAKNFCKAHLLIGILAGLVMLLTNVLQAIGFITPNAGLTFVSFIAWSCYFFSGCTPKDALISWSSFIVGIICAVIIFLFGNQFSGLGMSAAYIALPLAVVIGVILMDLGEKLPFANRVSAIYLGAATYFGMMGIPAVAEKGYLLVAVAELVYAAIGLFSGYLTVKILNYFSTKA